MNASPLRVSPPILALEVALGFLPLSLGCVGLYFGPTGLARMNASALKHALAQPGGAGTLCALGFIALLCLAGPVGLTVGARAVLTGKSPRPHALGLALVIAPLLLALAALLLRLHGEDPLWGPRAVGSFDFWSVVLLLGVVPALVAVHLRGFARGATPGTAD